MKMQYLDPENTMIRRRGGRRLAGSPVAPPGAESDARKLVQELQLHKIELELQNDELRQTQAELKESWARIDQQVVTRTTDLTRALDRLAAEVQARYQAELSLHGAFSELEAMKERLQAENAYLHQQLDLDNHDELPGPSPAMARLWAQIDAAAAVESPVLLLGEPGTCKSIIARLIHGRSARRHWPLVILRCATLAPDLVEATLFGQPLSPRHRIGPFELAHQGTLVLDEIAMLPPSIQAMVLEAIRELGVPSPGSGHRPEVRIIATSNRDLREAVRRGRFREDLYACLGASPIQVPPLREHLEDIPSLAEMFMARFNRSLGKDFKTISERTLSLLKVKAWPGNVRELKYLIEMTMVASSGSVLDLPPRQGDQRH